MKSLKTLVAVGLFVLGATVMVQAQGQGRGNRQMRSATERAKMETESMVKALELKADQTPKIQDINYKYAVKDSIRFDEMRKDREAGKVVDREEMMKKMNEQREAKTIEVKALLTEDQKTKYDELQKQRDQRRPRQNGEGRPEGTPQGTN